MVTLFAVVTQFSTPYCAAACLHGHFCGRTRTHFLLMTSAEHRDSSLSRGPMQTKPWPQQAVALHANLRYLALPYFAALRTMLREHTATRLRVMVLWFGGYWRITVPSTTCYAALRCATLRYGAALNLASLPLSFVHHRLLQYTDHHGPPRV